MTRALRCLPLLALLLLGACQSLPWSEAGRAQERERLQFERMLAGGELEAAGHNLERLRAQDAPQAEHYQRLLADAWLQRSQQALERGDLNSATTALARARALMPRAPALTNGLGGALQPQAPDAVEGDSDVEIPQ
jgi:cytochrome c-type biogenesis protein CcmH/NrfG